MRRILLLFFILTTLFSTAQEKVRVACIGNSVTYGYGHDNPSETSYPSQLAKMLGDNYNVANFGHSGATLLNKGHRPYTKQKAYTDALAFAPDVAVIHLGLNDTDPRNWPNYRDEFVGDYLSLIDTLRTINPDVKIWICRMTPIFNHHRRFKSGTREWFWQIQKAIEHEVLPLAAPQLQDATSNLQELPQVQLIDLHTPLYNRPDLFSDALHPNPEGAGIIAQTVYSAITGDYGGLSMPAIYSDNMVIQRGKYFNVSGKANACAKVVVTLGKQKRTEYASADGTWQCSFNPMEPDGKEYTLTVESEDRTLQFKNIVVGEVWLCSGQSNMAWMVKQTNGAEQYIQNAVDKNIRIYDMKPRIFTDNYAWPKEELENLNKHNHYKPASWQNVTTENIANFSAVAYHFGAMLADSLKMPVGLICNAIGGAPTESFIDRKTLEFDPVLVDILYHWRKNDMVQDWVRGRAEKNIELAQNPLQRHPYEPAYLFETAIEPLTCYPLRGFVWYQGESNAHNVELYDYMFPRMVDSWRRAWSSHLTNEILPFIYVQLSSINRPSWPHFRNVQRLHQYSVDNCYMAVSSDKGHPTDVHPRDKKPIGERLARQALYNVYKNKNIVSSGPTPINAEASGQGILITFENSDGMHLSNGDNITTFELAGEYGKFYPAEVVKIDNNSIYVESSKVANPLRVRYAWQPYTTANLVNLQGLPAGTFMLELNQEKGTLVK
ncbi:MAG: sialate O-acetylesterase [Bacteroidaceae bacterium]|nr:sialate O-acetylesterase [Bacteroidaceae bacterium]